MDIKSTLGEGRQLSQDCSPLSLSLLLLLQAGFIPLLKAMTPWTAAYQAPSSMGFSRQEYWSGVPSPSLTLLRCYSIVLLPKCLVAQLCLCNPWDCSPSGSSVDRIFQARILKWVAIFSSRHLPDPGIKFVSPVFPALQADSLPTEPLGKPLLLKYIYKNNFI